MSTEEDKPTITEETRPEQVTTPEPATESKANPDYNLLTSWVQGGTRSSAHDKEMARLKFDAEKRRMVQDEERAIASKPIEQGGGRMYNTNFSDNTDPQVLLRYVNSKRETEMEILCELVRDEASGKWMLAICCPECVKNGAPMDQAQFHIRQGHRKWDIDTRGRGEPKTYEDVDFLTGKKVKLMYIYAGMIMDTEILRCPNVACGGVRYKISENMLMRVR